MRNYNTTIICLCQVMKKFGKKLRHLRKQRGLTLVQVGEMLEVNNTFVSRMERGKVTPNAAMILKVSHLFEVTTDQLMKDDLELDE